MIRWAILAAMLLPAAAHAQALQYVDRSGAVQGNRAQNFAAAWAARRGCMVQNLSAGDLWVRVTGGGATLSQPSVQIPTATTWHCPSPPPSGALSIIGATDGQAFTAWEW